VVDQLDRFDCGGSRNTAVVEGDEVVAVVSLSAGGEV
jgi:hypothetical protein